MKEIDFLPQWYRNGCQQKRKHREFYIAMALIIVVMIAWNVFAHGRVAVVKARNTTLQNSKLIQDRCQNEYYQAQKQYQQLQKKEQILEKIDSHIYVSNVIAELSHLLDSSVVLKSLEIKAEKFEKPQQAAGYIQLVGASQKNAQKNSEQERFKIVLNGAAADAETVAEVINKLENSEYFLQVIPGISKNTTVDNVPVCEFQMSCYLANYQTKL